MLQEAEARIFVQDALLDPEPRRKLGPALAAKLDKLMTERTRALRYVSEFYDEGSVKHLMTESWMDRNEQLYRAAAEVAKALKQ